MRKKRSRNKNGVGRILTAKGYITVFVPSHPLAMKNGYVKEHRMMAWNAGILKDPSMEVHHINEVKSDNRLDNFKILSKPEHTSLTWSGKKRAPWTPERREKYEKTINTIKAERTKR